MSTDTTPEAPAGTTRRALRTDAAPPPAGAYSQGLAAGPYVYTSGLGPQDPASGEVPEGIGAQTAQVLANLAAVLAADGLSLADVVKSTVHLQHLRRDFAGFDAAYRAAFAPAGGPLPVRTTVGSDLMDILVEIDVVALRRA
ncbi:RidA family protein [Streptomyces sp. SPB074]|uniref:RidA family protein n=1 Tax=Streptomyces sp. (strain SPB074) TaxID=465543 RepID=UPI0001D1DBD9|nr:Rid family hydrolase [Streptomyces sp. SPB074]EFG65780.1 endoribonuclease L-PSP [Streptomyces sp. SPB074]